MTQQGIVIGTPDYLAPEQATDSHSVDIRGDLYSLGCTLYFLLTGTAPFQSSELIQKLIQHQMNEPTAVEQVRPDVPTGVAGIVRKLMAKQPADRYQTPAEAVAALAPFCVAGNPIPLAGHGEESAFANLNLHAAATGVSADTVGEALEYMSNSGEDLKILVTAPSRRHGQSDERLRFVLFAAVAVIVLLLIVVITYRLLKRRSAANIPPHPPRSLLVGRAPSPKMEETPGYQAFAALHGSGGMAALTQSREYLAPSEFEFKVTSR
jgi:serine/threonine protein kinase